MQQQNNPWQTATILGSIWGAFEIVAGSLLHNVGVPMVAGTFLSALGVIILVSGVRVFGGQGVFWRAALVCAALKTVSPSPVILSPMLGITIEGLLMELGVLLAGTNIIGYAIGGGLALLSVLAFKLFRLIMIYGVDIIEAYKSIFNIPILSGITESKSYLIPVILFILIYFIIGAFAAYTGYKGGNRIKSKINVDNIRLIKQANGFKPLNPSGYKGGVTFLLFHIAWLTVFIFIKNYVNPIYWLSGGILYLMLCLLRYGRVRQLMSRPTFWITIIIISAISSVFIQLGKDGSSIQVYKILENSLIILVRASVVLVAFACISIEMMSKGVSRHFGNSKFLPLAKSYNQAHHALPHLLATLKKDSRKVFQPIPLIEKMFTHFTYESNSAYPNKIFIITGDRQSGKTTFMKEMVALIEKEEIPLAGFIAEGLWDNNQQRSGFNLVTLPKKESILLCDRTTKEWLQFHSFFFNPTAIRLGKNALQNTQANAVVFVDEIGKFELEGKLWADDLSTLLSTHNGPIVLSIRNIYIDEVKQRWNLTNVIVVDASTECPEDICKQIVRVTTNP
ncbi:MAG TPA: hypothetical protein DG754_03145 [Bacteroidales bacterium]|nr:hypothetical protein [Bacteroidales bacterium]